MALMFSQAARKRQEEYAGAAEEPKAAVAAAKAAAEAAADDSPALAAPKPVVNASGKVVAGPAPKRSAVESYQEFCEAHESLLEEFATCTSLERSEAILRGKGDILLQVPLR